MDCLLPSSVLLRHDRECGKGKIIFMLCRSVFESRTLAALLSWNMEGSSAAFPAAHLVALMSSAKALATSFTALISTTYEEMNDNNTCAFQRDEVRAGAGISLCLTSHLSSSLSPWLSPVFLGHPGLCWLLPISPHLWAVWWSWQKTGRPGPASLDLMLHLKQGS